VRSIRITLMLTAALVLQTVLAHSTGNRTVIDVVVVTVIYFALTGGPVVGIVLGSVAGLAQDVLSGGVVGVSGFANCLVGCVTGIVGTQFIVASTLPRFVVFVLGSLGQMACVIGLYALIGPRGIAVTPATLGALALLNGVVGVLAFVVVERTPQIMERRRLRRAHVRTRSLG
jgi:rod shape-determining protein MreD